MNTENTEETIGELHSTYKGYTITKLVYGHAYARNGNHHNPAPRVLFIAYSPEGKRFSSASLLRDLKSDIDSELLETIEETPESPSIAPVESDTAIAEIETASDGKPMAPFCPACCTWNVRTWTSGDNIPYLSCQHPECLYQGPEHRM